METDVNYTLVGAFVIALVGAIVLGIILLSSGLSFSSHYITYKVYMKESVSGLSIESPVEYNGVVVGSVKHIGINHKNPKLVVLLLSIQASTPITKGTTASLDLKGITGNMIVALADKGTNLAPLEAENDEEYPVINTIPSILVKLDTALSSLTDSFHQMSTSVRLLLDSENLNSIKLTLQNLDHITNNLVANTQRINDIMQDTSQASRQFAPLLSNANQALQNINDISQNLSSTSFEIKQNPAILIRGKQPSALGPGEH